MTISGAVPTLSRNTWLGIGLAAGASFVAYCIYFDHKRRSAPDFKAKLRERRRDAAAAKKTTRATGGIPDITDPAQIQQYFLQEIQLGEELLATGQDEQAMEHLKNAVMLCGRPSQLLGILEQQLSPDQFKMLTDMLPPIAGPQAPPFGGGAPAPALEEQDLE